MATKTTTTESNGFSSEERAAMKARAAELRAEGKNGAKKADGLQALLDAIAKMTPEDRAVAERVHVTVSAHAPDLAPKTWYGMPAYANAEGKVVLSLKNSGKFGQRYSTLEFQDSAHLDDGDMWPVSYALEKWTPAVEKKVAELVNAAILGGCRRVEVGVGDLRPRHTHQRDDDLIGDPVRSCTRDGSAVGRLLRIRRRAGLGSGRTGFPHEPRDVRVAAHHVPVVGVQRGGVHADPDVVGPIPDRSVS